MLVNTDFFSCSPFTQLLFLICSKIKSLISTSLVRSLYEALPKHAFRHPLQFSLTALLFFFLLTQPKLLLSLPELVHQVTIIAFITEKFVVHCDVAFTSVARFLMPALKNKALQNSFTILPALVNAYLQDFEKKTPLHPPPIEIFVIGQTGFWQCFLCFLPILLLEKLNSPAYFYLNIYT